MNAAKTLQVNIEHVMTLAALLNEKIGLKTVGDGHQGLRLALEARLMSGTWTPEEYLRLLRGRDGDGELRHLLPLVTVGKTEFFRDSRQFRALRNVVLPQLIKEARRANRKVSIWSAGCATGEEPYSLAILTSELGLGPGELHLVATDVNPVAVAAAREGIFASRRMMGLSPEQISRFFEPRHGGFHVRPEIREPVFFLVNNLATDDLPVAPGGSWDLILCRNVFIYFDLSSMVRTLDRMRNALRVGGYLFLGYSESLYRIYDRFQLMEIEGSFVYRRLAEGEMPSHARPAPPPRVPPEELHRSIEELRRRRQQQQVPASPAPKPQAAPSPPPSAPQPASLPPEVTPRLDRAAALASAGKFSEAVGVLEGTLARNPDDLPVRLTLANLFSVTGRLDEACRTYEACLAQEPLSAEAHALLGVARTEAGQLAEARRELTRAIFLEPALPLAHYYLGRVAELGRDHEAARRAYRNAIDAARNPNARTRLMGFYPDLPEDPEVLARAAEYALGLVE